MDSIPYEASLAINKAAKALRIGDKNSARRFARQASVLAPDLEYAWLILAEVSPLKARINYLERAIHINPGRASSHLQLKSAREMMTNQTDLVSRINIPQVKPIHTPKNYSTQHNLAVPLFLLIIIGGGFFLWGWLGKTKNVLAAILPVSQAVSTGAPETWGGMNLPKPTQTPTLTPTPVPTSTPTQLPTAILLPTQQKRESNDQAGIQFNGDRYIVQSGDTLFKISQNFGVSLFDLADINSINTQAIIYTGQTLLIPGPGHVSISTPAPLEPLPLDENEKYILVDISEQHLYAYESGLLVYSFVASTGMNNATRVGVFSVLDKIPNAYGATWNIWMPNWLGIYWAGSLQNGIHALPILSNGSRLWAGYLGTPISYGCVVLGVNESQQLYDWVSVGTQVEIQW